MLSQEKRKLLDSIGFHWDPYLTHAAEQQQRNSRCQLEASTATEPIIAMEGVSVEDNNDSSESIMEGKEDVQKQIRDVTMISPVSVCTSFLNLGRQSMRFKYVSPQAGYKLVHQDRDTFSRQVSNLSCGVGQSRDSVDKVMTVLETLSNQSFSCPVNKACNKVRDEHADLLKELERTCQDQASVLSVRAWISARENDLLSGH